MNNFHDQKLWQDAFVVLMDVHTTFENGEDASNPQAGGEDVSEDCIESATLVAAKMQMGFPVRINVLVGRYFSMP